MVSESNILNFLRLHYKPERIQNEKGFNEDREERKVKDVVKDFNKDGYSIITYQSSVTNENIIFNNKLEILKKEKGKTLNISCLF